MTTPSPVGGAATPTLQKIQSQSRPAPAGMSGIVEVVATVEKLAELLDAKHALLGPVACREVKDLQYELSAAVDDYHIHLSFTDAEHQIGESENQLRDIAYDIGDWADHLTIRVDAAAAAAAGISRNLCFRFEGWWFRSVACKLKASLTSRRRKSNDNNKLQHFKKRLREIGERRHMRYRLHEAQHTRHRVVVDPRHRALYHQETDRILVGIARQMEEVTKMLTGSGNSGELKTVSIVGMAGSGKTTLANEVYKVLGEKNCFQCQAFVSVTQKLDLGETLMGMLSQLGEGQQVDGDIDHLIGRLRELLEKKRYLIVVDDLWSDGEFHWEIIRSCFPENSLGSRIIMTTRDLRFAMRCSSSPNDCIYNIRLLSDVDSKELILNRTFANFGPHCPSHYLEDVLPVITRRCGGLPLALVTVASMLSFQFTKEKCDWSIGSKWLSDPDAGVMKQTLDLSYNSLPPHLKTCLLYLSTFPWNKEVDVDRLVWRWNAEGFVTIERPGASVEETARDYLHELIGRYMVQPLPLNKDGTECCRLHPVMHDFIVCKSEDEKFATHHRISVQGSGTENQDLAQQGVMNASGARSVTIFSQASIPKLCLTNLSVVRVLDLEGCVGPVCLDGLDKLALLRYLSLKGTDVNQLPATIGELKFLETLDVRSTKLKELPRSIVGLRGTLRTLLFNHEGMVNSIETARIAEDIQQCRRLENVSTIDLREHQASFVKSLGALGSLKVITIIWSFQQWTDPRYHEALLSSIEKWPDLKSLTIQCGLGCSMDFLGSLSGSPRMLKKFKVTAGFFVSIPKWIQKIDSLVFVQINVCRLTAEDLKILSRLPCLECLMLGLDFIPREAIMIESSGFNELVRFSINCPLPWLTFDIGAIPKLTHLKLEFCSGPASQETVPYGIGNLQRIKEVVLLYNQEWCDDSSSVKMTVGAVKRQVFKHRNLIDLFINDNKVDYVQEIGEEVMSITEVESGDSQQVAKETVRTAAEQNWGEIEIEA